MIPIKMTSCRFFAYGSCKNGNSCRYIHEQSGSSQNPGATVLTSATNRPDVFPVAVSSGRTGTICRYFAQGSCQKGEECGFAHLQATLSSQEVQPGPILLTSRQITQNYDQTPSDFRAKVPCRFQLRPGGCERDHCPFSHAIDDYAAEKCENAGYQKDEASYFIVLLFGINNKIRIKSMTMTSHAIFQEHWSNLMILARSSKSLFLQTIPSHELQGLHKEQTSTQSSESSMNTDFNLRPIVFEYMTLELLCRQQPR